MNVYVSWTSGKLLPYLDESRLEVFQKRVISTLRWWLKPAFPDEEYRDAMVHRRAECVFYLKMHCVITVEGMA